MLLTVFFIPLLDLFCSSSDCSLPIVLFNAIILVHISLNRCNYFQQCRHTSKSIPKVNQIAEQLRLLPINHKKISCASKRLPLSSRQSHPLFLTLAITMKTTKVWSIVRSIWNCMPATSTRPCRTISIDSMLLSRVRSKWEDSNESNACLFRTPKILQKNGRRRKWTCQQVHGIPKQTWWYHRPLGHQGLFICLTFDLDNHYLSILETTTTKLELTTRSSWNSFTTRKGCLSSSAWIARIRLQIQVCHSIFLYFC